MKISLTLLIPLTLLAACKKVERDASPPTPAPNARAASDASVTVTVATPDSSAPAPDAEPTKLAIPKQIGVNPKAVIAKLSADNSKLLAILGSSSSGGSAVHDLFKDPGGDLDSQLSAANKSAGVSTGSGGGGAIGSIGGGGAGRGPSPTATVARAILTIDKLVVLGGLPEDQGRQVVLKHANRVRSCYERALKTNPTAGGTLTLELGVNTNGLVMSAKATGTSDEIDRCVQAAARTWRFPTSPDDETKIVVHYLLRRG